MLLFTTIANLPFPYVIGPCVVLVARGISAPCSRQTRPFVDVTTRLAPNCPPTARNLPSPNAIPPKGSGLPSKPGASTLTLLQTVPSSEASIVHTDPAPFAP